MPEAGTPAARAVETGGSEVGSSSSLEGADERQASLAGSSLPKAPCGVQSHTVSSPIPRLPWGPVSKIPTAPISPPKLLPEEPALENASNPDVRLVDLPGQALNLEVETVAVDGSKVTSVASPAEALSFIKSPGSPHQHVATALAPRSSLKMSYVIFSGTC